MNLISPVTMAAGQSGGQTLVTVRTQASLPVWGSVQEPQAKTALFCVKALPKPTVEHRCCKGLHSNSTLLLRRLFVLPKNSVLLFLGAYGNLCLSGIASPGQNTCFYEMFFRGKMWTDTKAGLFSVLLHSPWPGCSCSPHAP